MAEVIYNSEEEYFRSFKPGDQVSNSDHGWKGEIVSVDYEEKTAIVRVTSGSDKDNEVDAYLKELSKTEG